MVDLFIKNIGLLATPQRKHRNDLSRPIEKMRNAAILIREGRIEAVGTEDSIQSQSPAGIPVFDAAEMMVLPGLVDCHTHPVFIGNRAGEFHLRNAGKTYQEIAAAGGGIQVSARQVRAASQEQIVAESLPRFRRSLASGVTTIEGKSGYGLDWAGEEKLLLALAEIETRIPQRLHKTFLIHVLPESHKDKREAFCQEVIAEMVPTVAERKLATAVDVFCENGAFTVEESRSFLTTAQKLGLQVSVHANQFGHSGGALLAAELGARSADHLEFLNEAEMDAMAKAGTVGVVLPASVFFLGTSPYPPVRAMIERGMRIAISTDMNPGSSMTESLPLCLTTAAIYCKMSPDELLWAATLDAARVLGVDHEVGAIEPGMYADLSLWDMPNLESLSYRFGTTRAAAVFIAGQKVYEDHDAYQDY